MSVTLITMNWRHDLEGVLGKFEVSPSRQAQLAWELLKKYPDKYYFEVGYIEHEDGSKELTKISLVPRIEERRMK